MEFRAKNRKMASVLREIQNLNHLGNTSSYIVCLTNLELHILCLKVLVEDTFSCGQI